MTNDQKQLILGSLLGSSKSDDSTYWRNSNKRPMNAVYSPTMEIVHTAEELPYLSFKYEVLHNFSTSISRKESQYVPKKYIEPKYSVLLRNSIREDWFLDISKAMKGKKAFCRELFDSLDLGGVAVWLQECSYKTRYGHFEWYVEMPTFAGDYFLFKSSIDRLNQRLGLDLEVTRSFSQDKHQNLPDELRVPALIIRNGTIKKIAAYMHPFFKEEVSKSYGQGLANLVGTYTGWKFPSVDGRANTTVTVVEIVKDPSKKYLGRGKMRMSEEDRYDIEVEGNHSYCVDGIFVHNSPEYEPGGAAPKYYSSVRLHNKPRALSGVPFNPKGKGQYEEEESVTVEGGKDTYRYVHSKAVKNKLSVPNRETWLRIWVQDGNLEANGFDPVWDTFYVMAVTGQLYGKRSAITLNVHGLGEAKKSLTWGQFKLLILGTKEQKTQLCERVGYRPMDLRKGMFKMMANGTLERLYMENSKAKSKKTDDDDAGDAEEAED
jgi:hypothetical protein